MKPDESNDLDWMAFQYLADELDQTQRDKFKARLADDQQAREALASAVELTQTISAASHFEHAVTRAERPASDAPKKIRRWRRVAWISTTVAGCLAVLFAYQFIQSLQPIEKSGKGIASQNNSEHQELARRWIETVDETVVPERAEDEFALDQEDADSPEFSFSSDEPLFTTPDWMLAAVSGLAGEMDVEKMKETGEN